MPCRVSILIVTLRQDSTILPLINESNFQKQKAPSRTHDDLRLRVGVAPAGDCRGRADHATLLEDRPLVAGGGYWRLVALSPIAKLESRGSRGFREFFFGVNSFHSSWLRRRVLAGPVAGAAWSGGMLRLGAACQRDPCSGPGISGWDSGPLARAQAKGPVEKGGLLSPPAAAFSFQVPAARARNLRAIMMSSRNVGACPEECSAGWLRVIVHSAVSNVTENSCRIMVASLVASTDSLRRATTKYGQIKHTLELAHCHSCQPAIRDPG